MNSDNEIQHYKVLMTTEHASEDALERAARTYPAEFLYDREQRVLRDNGLSLNGIKYYVMCEHCGNEVRGRCASSVPVSLHWRIRRWWQRLNYRLQKGERPQTGALVARSEAVLNPNENNSRLSLLRAVGLKSFAAAVRRVGYHIKKARQGNDASPALGVTVA